jgi:hypothetical protein
LQLVAIETNLLISGGFMSKEERAKLTTLLNYWIEHNKEHSQEFEEWANNVKESGDTEVAEEMLQAVQDMDRASECLLRALRKLEEKEA